MTTNDAPHCPTCDCRSLEPGVVPARRPRVWRCTVCGKQEGKHVGADHSPKMALMEQAVRVKAHGFTEAEALSILYEKLGPSYCIVIEGDAKPMWVVSQPEAELIEKTWLGACRSFGLLK